VFFGTLYGHLVVALNKQRIMTLGYIFVAIISVGGYLWLIPEYGMWGGVWVTLVSEGLIALITFGVVYRSSKALPNPTVFLKSLIASLIMYVVLSQIHAPVMVDLIMGAALYSGSLLILKAVTIKEIRGLLPRR